MASLTITNSRAQLIGTKPVDEAAPGRLQHLEPVAVVDIGSNSVRLVVYEGATRSATPVFNEKVLCGLGRHVATRGVLDEEAIQLALHTLTRFRALWEQIAAGHVHVVATAAVREARNGGAFVRRAEAVVGCEVRVLTGTEEARMTGFGVLAGMREPAGLAADLGGGSLELVEVAPDSVGSGTSLPLGSLRLQDLVGRSVKKSRRLVAETLEGIDLVDAARERDLYAIGGTFRALARLHMAQTGHPLHVMHGYQLDPEEALEFCRLVQRVRPDSLDSIEVVTAARRPLLPHGAVVLEHLIRHGGPQNVVISALGVREGLLHALLPEEERREDPLLSACAALSYLRSRSPHHARELCAWSDAFMASSGLDETAEERRLRHAACLLADIGWRAHPDYRGEQSLNIIAHAAFFGIDHPGRAFLALAVFYRHAGFVEEHLGPRLRELVTTRMLDRARILGGLLRVGYLISAALPGVVDRAPLLVEEKRLVLHLPGDLKRLVGERVFRRLKQLGKLIGRKPAIETSG